MKNIIIEKYAADDAPTCGARRVWFWNGKGWEPKGWLMPTLLGYSQ